VLRKRDEVVAAGPSLVGEQDDSVVGRREFPNGLGVALEPAVVLRFALGDRGVQIESDENALCGIEVVEGSEGGCGRGHLWVGMSWA
jgi:hypothetical protein